MDYKYLGKVNSPDDLKQIPEQELDVLCAEIRDCLISTVSENGGHLASNLGVVELTVALHRVFNSPTDSIIFDVGHQCYTHKILTGRYDKFPTIRKEGGLSGFMRPDESEHDPFITGHSSNSISAAYGIAKAKQLLENEGCAVAVVGDGAMTGGMIYEALNNAGTSKKNFIVVLNDNKMSISRNVGALSRYFTAIRTSNFYHKFKRAVLLFLSKIPALGSFLRTTILRSKLIIKNAIYDTSIFEAFGFHYLGPVDGHDTAKLIKILDIARKKNCPVLVHIITKKGKGYEPAENKPMNYHGVSPFNVSEGVKSASYECFSSVFGETVLELAENDNSVCAITAAMTEGTGLIGFKKNFPERFFDVGIAEEHAVTFAAGLASKGMKPYFAVYSSFLQRGYDQIIHDAAIAGLNVTLCVDRAGFVGEDGETHNGLFDVPFLTSIPNIKIYSPTYHSELRSVLKKSAKNNELCAIRYPRGAELDKCPSGVSFNNDYTLFENKSDTLLISYGRIFANVLKAENELNSRGISVDALKLNKIFPIDKTVISIVKKYKKVYFYEEGIRNGSIAEKLGAMLFEAGISDISYKIFAVDDGFVKSAKTESLFKKYKFDFESIIKEIADNNG